MLDSDFIKEIAETSTMDLFLILDDQQDLYTEEEIAAIRKEANSRKDLYRLQGSPKDNRLTCIVCEKKIGFFMLSQECQDGLICFDCYNQLGFYDCNDGHKNLTLAEIEEAGKKELELYNEIQLMQITDDVCPAAKFDDESEQMILSDDESVFTLNEPQLNYPYKFELFSYRQIISFELIENGENIASGGVGRALVGGLLFGDVGAVVGANTRGYTQECVEMKVKITVKDYRSPAFYIPLIAQKTSKKSWKYKERQKMAHDIISKLQIIASSQKQSEQRVNVEGKIDKFQEIREYKALLDEGLISQAEFNKKKKELLGL